jgi:mannosyl-oligosaccharide glucosidase
MWGEPGANGFDVRHEARHEHDLAKFGWERHDLRHYGRQVIIDHGLQISTAFMKVSSAGRLPNGALQARLPGEGYGGAWNLQMNASEAEDGALGNAGGFAILYFYFGDLTASANTPGHSSLEAFGPPSIDVRSWLLHRILSRVWVQVVHYRLLVLNSHGILVCDQSSCTLLRRCDA